VEGPAERDEAGLAARPARIALVLVALVVELVAGQDGTPEAGTRVAAAASRV